MQAKQYAKRFSISSYYSNILKWLGLMNQILFRIEIDFCLFGKWFTVFECVGVAQAVFRPGLGVSSWHHLSGGEKVGREGGEWSPPTPALHLQRERERERGLNQDREREREITGVGGPAFYLLWKPLSFILQEREREGEVLSFSALVVVLKTSRQLARTDNEICLVPGLVKCE